MKADGARGDECHDEYDFAEWVAAVGEQIRGDDSFDLDAQAAPHPQWAERIRRLMPAMETLKRHGASSDTLVLVPGGPARSDRGLVGSLVDFVPIREIGRGGMGIVYEALQVSLNRHIALKILPHAWNYDPRMLKRFQVEAQAAGRLRHAHIVPVYLVGFENGVHYYAMQLIKGRTLAEVISASRGATEAAGSDPPGTRGGPIPSRTVAELGRQAAEALHFAHGEGVVHRDIKPANLLVEESGWLWVADFGLARLQGGQDTTAGESIKGTLRYMSPEQALGEPTAVDHRTDIYSLGATLYELVTLRPAFDGDDRLELFRRIAREEPRLPRRIDPTIPLELATIVMKAMAKNPAERYATAGELATDLQRFLEHRRILARPSGVVRRSTRWALYHKPAVAFATFLLFCLAAAIGAIALWRDLLRDHNIALNTALKAAERDKQINRSLLRGSQLRLAQQELSAGHVELAQQVLERLRQWPGKGDSLGFEWHYLRRLAHRDLSLLAGHAAPVHALALSADGSMLISGDHDGIIIFWDLIEKRERGRASGHRFGVSLLALSPDNRVLASVSESHDGRTEVKLWDPVTARETVTLSETSEFINRIAFSHDGRTLAVCEFGASDHEKGSRVWLWDVSLGPKQTRVAGPPILCTSVSPSPDRRLLATAGSSGSITLRDFSTGRSIRTLSRRFPSISSIGFSPDGRSVLVNHDESLTLLNAATGQEEGRLERIPAGGPVLCLDVSRFPGMPVGRGNLLFLTDAGSNLRETFLEGSSIPESRFAFSPDRRLLARCGERQPATLWDTATGRKHVTLPGNVLSLAFTPRGESLIAGGADSKIRAWHIERRPDPLDRLAGHKAEVWSLAYTPDGTTIATGSDDHAIKLWDPRTGQLQTTLTGHDALVGSLAVSPDGRMLASASFDKTVRLWDLPSGRARNVLHGHTDRVRTLAFSADGKTLASASSDFTVRLWDPVEGCERQTLRSHTDSVHAVAFDPNSSRLVSTGGDRTLRVWGTVDGQELRTIACSRQNTSVAFSRDGSRLATGDDWGNVTVWDVETWSKHTGIKGSEAPIWSLAFSPDGQTLAAGCGDATARLWDPVTGQLTLVLAGHIQRVNAVAFAPDGRTLASASHAGEVKLWQTVRP